MQAGPDAYSLPCPAASYQTPIVCCKVLTCQCTAWASQLTCLRSRQQHPSGESINARFGAHSRALIHFACCLCCAPAVPSAHLPLLQAAKPLVCRLLPHCDLNGCALHIRGGAVRTISSTAMLLPCRWCLLTIRDRQWGLCMHTSAAALPMVPADHGLHVQGSWPAHQRWGSDGHLKHSNAAAFPRMPAGSLLRNNSIQAAWPAPSSPTVSLAQQLGMPCFSLS